MWQWLRAVGSMLLSADDLAMCLGDFNGHAGRHVDGFDRVHGEYGVSERKLEGRMLLDLSGEGITCQIHGLREMKIGR